MHFMCSSDILLPIIQLFFFSIILFLLKRLNFDDHPDLFCMRAGAGDPREQVEAGHEAGHLRAGVVRHLPLLLRHDRVQRVHLRQPAHVHGGVEYCAGIAYQNLNAPIATQHFSFSFDDTGPICRLLSLLAILCPKYESHFLKRQFSCKSGLCSASLS